MSFDWSFIERNADVFIEGAKFTISLTIFATVCGVVFGTLLALMRLSNSRIASKFATTYVVLFRSVPLVQILLIFYLFVPLLARLALEQRVSVSAETASYMAFAFFEAAYFAEIIRAGIRSVSPGQFNAALAIGLPKHKAMRFVVLPQAFLNVVPILLTQTIVLFQDVSLVYAIGALDFFGASQRVVQIEFRPVEVYIFVAAVYFTICFTLSKLVMRLQRKLTKNLNQVGANT